MLVDIRMDVISGRGDYEYSELKLPSASTLADMIDDSYKFIFDNFYMHYCYYNTIISLLYYIIVNE